MVTALKDDQVDPQGPPTERVETTIERLTRREREIAAAVAENDNVKLRALFATPSEITNARNTEQVIARAKEQLGDAFTGAFADTEHVVILASDSIPVAGAVVIKVPHSLTELEAILESIKTQISDRDIPDGVISAWISKEPGLVIVIVCGDPDYYIDLSAFPATAVDYHGWCYSDYGGI